MPKKLPGLTLVESKPQAQSHYSLRYTIRIDHTSRYFNLSFEDLYGMVFKIKATDGYHRFQVVGIEDRWERPGLFERKLTMVEV